MTNSNYSLALSLQKKGYTLQQIADDLGIGKTSVHRLLNNPPDEEDMEAEYVPEFVPERAGPNSNSHSGTQGIASQQIERAYSGNVLSPEQIELERLRIGYEHERLMADLELKRKEIENQSYALAQKAADAKAVMLAQEKEMEEAQGKIDRKAAKLLKRYTSVLDAFCEQIGEATWGKSDWEAFVEKANTLSEDITTFIENVLDEETDDLIAIENLRIISELAQGFIDNHGFFSGSVVDTKLDEEGKQMYEDLQEVEAINDEFEI
jgi:hypothetical protein